MRLAAAPTRESRHPGHSPGARAAWAFIGNIQAHFESSIRPRMRLDMAQDRSPARASRLHWPENLILLVPGFLVSVVIAVAARFLSDHYGAPAMLMALLLGIAFHFLAEEGRCVPGIVVSAKGVLRFGVALLGIRERSDGGRRHGGCDALDPQLQGRPYADRQGARGAPLPMIPGIDFQGLSGASLSSFMRFASSQPETHNSRSSVPSEYGHASSGTPRPNASIPSRNGSPPVGSAMAGLSGFSLVCLPAHVEVQLTCRANRRANEDPGVGRIGERDMGQIV